MTNAAQLTALLHLASPALPVGAFSYSQGLEWQVDCGAIRNEQDAGEWIVAVLDAGTLLAINGLGGPLQRPMQALLLMYGLVLAWCVLNAARGFHARLVSEREAARQGQLVALLLRDFEEHAASLLWEVGADGCLTHVAPRLAQALDGRIPVIGVGGIMDGASAADTIGLFKELADARRGDRR
mgnify:CR=1 FL=1